MPSKRDEVIVELKQLSEEAANLRGQNAGSARHTQWITQVRALLRATFGEDSDLYRSFVALPWQRTGSFVIGGPMNPRDSMDPARAIARENHDAYLEQLDGARGMLLGALDQIQRYGLPRQPGFGDRLRASAETGITEGLHIGLRNGVVVLVTFLVGLLTGALTPLG
jgi:hypothetical protein